MHIQDYGVTLHDTARSFQGYTLFSRIFSDAVWLIDMQGNVVHEWKTSGGVTHFNYLRPNGNLFVCETSQGGPPLVAGKSGLMREYDWEGNIVWEHRDDFQHHDARRLDNGHCVYLAWVSLDKDTSQRVLGGMPGTEHENGIYGEAVREVDANGAVVFEWVNNDPDFMRKYPLTPLSSREEYGHANTVAVTPDGDYIVSYRVLNLLVIIDRATGKLKWEYHNPMLGGQHDSHILANGNVLVFANGYQTSGVLPVGSEIWEIDPRTREIVWRYKPGKNPLDFYSPHISGCQRLPNGNTLICEGGKGCLFEVTADGDVVWHYVSPFFAKHHFVGDMNWIFRAKRYASDSPEIRNRV